MKTLYTRVSNLKFIVTVVSPNQHILSILKEE